MQIVGLLAAAPAPSGDSGAARVSLGGGLVAAAEAAGAGPAVVLTPDGGERRWDWLQPALAEARRQAMRFLFLDLPLTDWELLEPAVAAADLLIIATGPGEGELAAAGALADVLSASGNQFFFLLAANSEEEELFAAATELAQHGTVAPVMLPPPSETQPLAELWSYLAGRLERLPQVGGRLAGRPPGGQERRAHPRYSYRQVGTLRRGEEVARCEIADISLGGVAAISDLVPLPGEELELHLPTVGRFPVELARQSENRLGLKFRLDAITRQRLLEHLWLLAEIAEPLPEPEPAPAPPPEPVPEPIPEPVPLVKAAQSWRKSLPAGRTYESALTAVRDFEEGLGALSTAIEEARSLQGALAEGLRAMTSGPVVFGPWGRKRAAAVPLRADPVLRRRIDRLFGT